MRKRNTLYTANKWNKPLFAPEENLFFNGGTTFVTPQTSRWAVLAGKDKKANPWDYMDDVDTTAQYMQQKADSDDQQQRRPFSGHPALFRFCHPYPSDLCTSFWLRKPRFRSKKRIMFFII